MKGIIVWDGNTWSASTVCKQEQYSIARDQISSYSFENKTTNKQFTSKSCMFNH